MFYLLYFIKIIFSNKNYTYEIKKNLKNGNIFGSFFGVEYVKFIVSTENFYFASIKSDINLKRY